MTESKTVAIPDLVWNSTASSFGNIAQSLTLSLLYNLIITSFRLTCFNCLQGIFSPTLYLITISPPIFTLRRFFALYLHSIIPSNSTGHEATICLDGAPNRRPPPLVCDSLSCLAATKSSLCKPLTFILHPVAPLCHPWPSRSSLSDPGVLPYEGWFLPLTDYVAHIYALSPSSLDRRSNTLLFLKFFHHVLLYLISCASTLNSLCSEPSLGIFCSLISLCVSFCISFGGQGASTPW